MNEALPNHGFVQCLQLLENAKGDLKAAHKSKLVFTTEGDLHRVVIVLLVYSSNVNDLGDVMFISFIVLPLIGSVRFVCVCFVRNTGGESK